MATQKTGWIEKLPQELINLICDHVTDQKTSKSLRLVSKRFKDRAAINVFRSLLLYPDPKKWAVLNEIAEVPQIASSVETIVLRRLANRWGAAAESYKLYEQHMVGLQLTDSEFWDRLRSFTDEYASFLESAAVTWSSSELEASWQRHFGCCKKDAELDFKNWYDMSFGRYHHNTRYPDPVLLEQIVHLENFHNLQNVETISYSNPIDSKAKVCELLGINERRAGHEEYPNKCLELLFRQLKRSRRKITSLRVTYLGEILDEAGRGLNLADLLTLTIDLTENDSYNFAATWLEEEEDDEEIDEDEGAEDDDYDDDNQDKSDDEDDDVSEDDTFYTDSRYSDWFKSAVPTLKNMKIIQRWANKASIVKSPLLPESVKTRQPALDIFRMFEMKKAKFSMLQTLHLEHVTTTASSLTKFLKRHRKTLVSLKIDRPCIDPIEWEELKQKIEEQAKRGYYGPKSGCEIVLTDAMTDPMGIDKDWKAFDSLVF